MHGLARHQWLLVETTATRAWCSGRGVGAVGNGRRRVMVRDLPIAGTPTVPVWAERTWRCREIQCPRGLWSETSEQIGALGSVDDQHGAAEPSGTDALPTSPEGTAAPPSRWSTGKSAT